MTAARRLAATSPPTSACASIGMARPKTAPTAAYPASKHACSSAAIMVAADRE